MKIIIISGRSGSGKSVALKSLEDHGFFCIDNLPLSLLPELVNRTEEMTREIAVSIDARNTPSQLSHLDDFLGQINNDTCQIQIVFLDANDATLLKRFSETRRRHPLTHEGLSLREAIALENKLLEVLSSRADLIIDTSSLRQYQLRDLIAERILNTTTSELNLMFESFGYKHGVPRDVDFVFDVRCLPNPYWEPSLRPFNGKDKEIIEFLQEQPLVMEMFWQIKVFLSTWLPRLETDSRSYVTVALGCTGGQHRSVYMTEQLANYFREIRKNVQVRHRDLVQK
ncbi:MAG: RNase adapter RapZ [Pseudomonadota bacterium]